MKNLKMFLMVLASAAVVSCSSDDDGPSNNGTLTAKWNPVKTTVKVGNSNTITQNYEGNIVGCPKNYIEFVPGGVLKRVTSYKDGDGNCQESTATSPANWTEVDDVVTITGESTYTGVYEISRLTNSELRLVEEDNTGGITTVTTLYFTKAPAN